MSAFSAAWMHEAFDINNKSWQFYIYFLPWSKNMELHPLHNMIQQAHVILTQKLSFIGTAPVWRYCLARRKAIVIRTKGSFIFDRDI